MTTIDITLPLTEGAPTGKVMLQFPDQSRRPVIVNPEEHTVATLQAAIALNQQRPPPDVELSCRLGVRLVQLKDGTQTLKAAGCVGAIVSVGFPVEEIPPLTNHNTNQPAPPPTATGVAHPIASSSFSSSAAPTTMVNANVVKLNYKLYECSSLDAPVIILVHGLTSSLHSFQLAAPQLQQALNANIICVDLRGHGDSPECVLQPGPSYRIEDVFLVRGSGAISKHVYTPTAPSMIGPEETKEQQDYPTIPSFHDYRLSSMAEDLHYLYHHLLPSRVVLMSGTGEWKKPHFVGHSFGSRVVMQLASMYPAFPGSIVVEDENLDAIRPPFRNDSVKALCDVEEKKKMLFQQQEQQGQVSTAAAPPSSNTNDNPPSSSSSTLLITTQPEQGETPSETPEEKEAKKKLDHMKASERRYIRNLHAAASSWVANTPKYFYTKEDAQASLIATYGPEPYENFYKRKIDKYVLNDDGTLTYYVPKKKKKVQSPQPFGFHSTFTTFSTLSSTTTTNNNNTTDDSDPPLNFVFIPDFKPHVSIVFDYYAQASEVGKEVWRDTKKYSFPVHILKGGDDRSSDIPAPMFANLVDQAEAMTLVQKEMDPSCGRGGKRRGGTRSTAVLEKAGHRMHITHTEDFVIEIVMFMSSVL